MAWSGDNLFRLLLALPRPPYPKRTHGKGGELWASPVWTRQRSTSDYRIRYWCSAHWRTESLPSVWRRPSNDGVSERRESPFGASLSRPPRRGIFSFCHWKTFRLFSETPWQIVRYMIYYIWKIVERRSHQMGIMNIIAIVVGVVLVTMAVGSISVSISCLRCLDPDIAFMSIVALICGVVAILAGIYLKWQRTLFCTLHMLREDSSAQQTQWRPSRTTSKQSSGAFLSINIGLYLLVITLPPGVRRSRNKWIRPDLAIQTNIKVSSTQRRPVYSLSFVRDTICPGQTYISSDATEMALWRFPDHAQAVCPSYEQTASGACFLASREVFLKKEFDRRYFARFVINILLNNK